MGGFGREFWTPYTVVLVSLTVVLLATLLAAVGYILFVLLYCVVVSLLPVKRETCIDEVFRELRRESHGSYRGPWQGAVAFHHEPTRAITMRLSIDTGDGPPTELQRDLFRQMVSRYASLWPDIAEALAANHPRLKTVEAVAQCVDEPFLALGPVVTGEPLTWSLDYTFDMDNEDEDSLNDFCLCSVIFVDWKIVGVDVAD